MRPKLLATTLIMVLLLAYYLLGTGYVGQRQGHEMLVSRIVDARQLLSQIPEPPQDMEHQLAAARKGLREVEDSFPSELNDTQIINYILRLAGQHNVIAIPLVTEGWSGELVGEHEYHVFRLNMAAEGNYSQLVAFLNGLDNGEYQTLVLEALTVSRIREQPEAEPAEGDSRHVTAGLKIAVYTSSPIPD